MADLTTPEVASWVQAGGLLAFAAAVYLELRSLRPFLAQIAESLAVLKDRVRAVPREESRPMRAPSQPVED